MRTLSKNRKLKKANVFLGERPNVYFGNGLIIINLTTVRKKKGKKKSGKETHRIMWIV